ncbi:MAG: hypothetical protein ACXACA_01730 [Candidatus Ranarchaeia archaeon]|jgi:hypothetical protein
MQPGNLVYEVDIDGRIYGFFVEINIEEKGLLQIPDAGGMADMSPKYPEQLTWLLSKLEEIHGLKRIWPTIWEFTQESTQKQLEDLFKKEGRLSERTRADFYTSNHTHLRGVTK